MTIVKEYMNKAGYTHMAHFSPAGNYLGRCSTMGNDPIEYIPKDDTPKTTSKKMVKMDSKDLGITTTIKEYTNQQGRKHMAHFTHNGKYYGPCTKYGSKPVYYEGYFDEETVTSHTKSN
jgi:uncharacterized protein with WD repeat